MGKKEKYENWRTGVFTREDLTSYRAEMTKRVNSVAFSIKSMKQKHPEFAELFDNLVNELVQSLSIVLDESVENLTDNKKLREAYQQLKTKEVTDSNGFITEYSLWHNTDDDTYICIFGDSEIYTPIDSYPDAEFDTEQQAYEWFNSYQGFDEVE